VTTNVSVTDSNGRAVKQLKKDDFRIFEDGVPQKIAHFAATEEPFSLMLLLDVSGSTRADLFLIKEAARSFLQQVRSDDRVGVIVFSGRVSQPSDLGASRSHTAEVIDFIATPAGTLDRRYTANTGTAFYDALYEAVESGGLKSIEGRKAIVCMSDGVDSTSLRTFRQVAPMVERSDASVYFLQLNTENATLEGLLRPKTDPDYINLSQSQLDRYFSERDPDSPLRGLKRELISPLILRDINAGLYDIARKELRSLAERTGGRVYPVNTLEDLKGVYGQVADDLRAQYSIAYYPTNRENDGRWREIRVQVDKPGATVRARSGYWARGRP
jgi:Ca-activated chloride channel family protein